MLVMTSVKAQMINVSGVLIDSVSKSKLPYGTVILKNQNDSIIKCLLTNDVGAFSVNNIAFDGGMYLSTRYLGYAERKVYLKLNKQMNVNLGDVLLVPTEKFLKGALVVGNVNYVEKKFDRKVYSMDGGKIAAARSVLDLLRVLPGVVVGDDGQIRYKGAEAAIYVDDQPLNFQYPNIEMIPVDKVDKIELIDAAMHSGGDGRSGIINIKFKKVNADGVSGMLSANVNSTCFESLDKSKVFLNLNYKKNKFTFFLNSSLENSFSKKISNMTKDISMPQTLTAQRINSTDHYQRQTNYNNAGLIYWPTSNTKIYLSCGFYNQQYKSEFEEEFTEKNSNFQSLINGYNNNVSSDDHQIYEGINLSYWHKFDTLDSYLKVYGSVNVFNTLSKQFSSYRFNQINSLAVDSLYSSNYKRLSNNNGIYLNVFFNRSISKVSRWNLSYNLSIGLKDTTANEQTVMGELNLPQSQFDINTNQQHVLSSRIGTKWRKWKMDGGVNLVDHLIDGSYLRFNTSVDDTVISLRKNYFRILPSATVAFELNKIQELKMTLSQTSNIPYFNRLSDFVDRKGLYNWSSGNSALKPVDFYSLYFGYSYSSDNCNISAECFYNYTDNEVANVSVPLTSQLYLTKPENIAQKTNIGIDLSVWYKLNGNLNFSFSSTLFHLMYDISALQNTAAFYNLPIDELVKKKFGYNLKCNVESKLKEFYMLFYCDYYAQELTFDGYRKPWINSSFNVSKKFLDNKLRSSVGINNIFGDMIKQGSFSKNFGISSETKTSGSIYNRLYLFSIQYNFRQGDRGTKDLRIGG